MIEFDQCRKSYGNHQVLTGLSFTAQDGTVHGLVGANGAGKTTAFRILLGTTVANSGIAHVDGQPFTAHRHPGHALGAYVAPNHIPSHMTGEGVLRFTADSLGVSRARNGEYLEAVGLAHAARHKVSTYSLGMRQRLGVAIAFVGEPRNLLLDEPVNGLDIEGVRWLREYLRAAAAQGRCILLSSHLLSELELVADRVTILENGKARRTGSLDELRAQDKARVRIRSANDHHLAAYLQSQALAAEITADGVVVNSESLLPVAAAVGAQNIEVTSIGFVTASLEDVYLDTTAAHVPGRSA